MSSFKRSLTIIGGQRVLHIAWSFAASVIIARLLTPEEIGVFSVCASLVAIAHVFREFGVGSYLIQERELTRERIRSALAVMFCFSWTIGISLFLGRHQIAAFYGNLELVNVMSVLALNFFLIPISSPVLSILRRNLKFGTVAGISLVSSFVATAGSVIMAYLGYGPASLAWGSVAGIVVTIMMSTYFHPPEVPWLPGFSEIRRVLSYGSKSSVNMLTNELGNSSPDLIMGRMLSLSDVGMYSRANGFASIVIDNISQLMHSVLFPTFSDESRTGKDVVQNFKNRTVMVSAVICPGLLFFAYTAEPLILFLYGDQWVPAAPLATIICLSALIYVPYTLAGSMIQSHGYVGYAAKTSFMVQTVRILSVVAGSMFGLIYVPIFGVSLYIGRYWAHSYGMKKFFGVGYREMIFINAKSFLVGLITLAPVAALSFALPKDFDLETRVLMYLGSAALAWLAAIYATNHLLKREIDVIAGDLRRKILPLRKT